MSVLFSRAPRRVVFTSKGGNAAMLQWRPASSSISDADHILEHGRIRIRQRLLVSAVENRFMVARMTEVGVAVEEVAIFFFYLLFRLILAYPAIGVPAAPVTPRESQAVVELVHPGEVGGPGLEDGQEGRRPAPGRARQSPGRRALPAPTPWALQVVGRAAWIRALSSAVGARAVPSASTSAGGVPGRRAATTTSAGGVARVRENRDRVIQLCSQPTRTCWRSARMQDVDGSPKG